MFKKDQGRQIVQQHIESQNILKRYIKGNLLGKGGFARCYEFISEETNRKYAAKIIEKASLTKPKAKQKLQSQIKIHKSLHHHHIVNFQHFFQDQEYVYILLQICRPETLSDLLKRRKRITQFEVKYYIYQITQALKYIHSKKVIHRDLKLGNLFLTDELNIKVGDFGLATKLNFDGQKRKTTCGTPNYLAPEILINKNGHSYEVDIWSIGIIAYALLFGRPPFQTNDLKLTYSKIKSCNYSFPDTMTVSPPAKKFITKILQLQPHKRPTINEILEDEFISSIQIPKCLPLATISIPPSSNLIKKYEKALIVNQNQVNRSSKIFIEEPNPLIESCRTLDKNKIMKSSDKIFFDKDIMEGDKYSGKENCLMQRAASTAGLMQRKKQSHSFKELAVCKQVVKQIPVRVLYFEQNPKFGISYMLSTGAFGMRYNDSTCIIVNSKQKEMKYSTIDSNLRQSSSQLHQFPPNSQHLLKKLKIINHYIKELKKKKTEAEEKMSNQLRIQVEKMRHKETPDLALKVYVIRSLKTSKAEFFEFSNSFIQVIFEDSSELVFVNPKTSSLINQTSTVTYISKFSQIKQFNFELLEKQSQDIKKRMNYILSVIVKMNGATSWKEKSDKQNRPQLQGNTSQRSLKENNFAMARSNSTKKLTIQPAQTSMVAEKLRRFNSSAKIATTRETRGESVPLRQIRNQNY